MCGNRLLSGFNSKIFMALQSEREIIDNSGRRDEEEIHM
jgi:hypothetical protein